MAAAGDALAGALLGVVAGLAGVAVLAPVPHRALALLHPPRHLPTRPRLKGVKN